MKVITTFGPPGTGKTRNQIERVGSLGKPALLLSFTKAAAAESGSRLPDGLPFKASTLHSFAFNALGLSRASMVDGKKLLEFGKAAGFAFKGEEVGVDEPQEGDEFAAVLQYANNRQMALGAAYDHFGRPGTLRRFQVFEKAYRAWKETYGYLDFDDLLLKFINLSQRIEVPPVVALDEAQDCSPLHWLAFERIIRPGAEIVLVAGDDDQAIYEWNGADPHGMVAFHEKYGTKLHILDKSWRVPLTVHDSVHSRILSRMQRRTPKSFKSAARSGALARYGDFWDVDLRGFKGMILARDRWRLDEIKRALNREMVPYEAFGTSSPWTSKTAQALRSGKSIEIPAVWREFYAQADLSQPINISLSTIHQAKGREADNVILDLQLSTKVINNIYKDRDAELRVMYVGMTRAAHNLTLTGENPLI